MFEENPIIAHRGAAAYAPENTLAAFKAAQALGARWIEFDVMLSQDEQAIVFHDDKVKRTTNGRGDVGKLSLEALQQLDAGCWFSKNFSGEKIPTFEQAVQCCEELSLQANIEIKPYPGQLEATTIAVMTGINNFGSHQFEPLVSSKEIKALELARSIDPDMKLGLLLGKWRDDWLTLATDLNVTSVHCNYRLLKPKRIKAIKDAGLYCLAYTVNKKKVANRLLEQGVDAVFSDYPDLLV